MFHIPRVKFFYIICICISFVTVATLDGFTGAEAGFFAFYFIPIALAAWWLNLITAVVLAIGSALVWLGMNVADTSTIASPFIAGWNMGIRLIAFIVVAFGISHIRHLLEKERKTTEDLRRALAEIMILEGILPVCASCKKIRDNENQWHPMEVYISSHSKAEFSHGLCPECARRFMEEAGLSERKETPEAGGGKISQ